MRAKKEVSIRRQMGVKKVMGVTKEEKMFIQKEKLLRKRWC